MKPKTGIDQFQSIADGRCVKFFKMFEKPKSLEDFKAEMEVVIAELQTFKNKSDDAFQTFMATDVNPLINQLTDLREKVKEAAISEAVKLSPVPS